MFKEVLDYHRSIRINGKKGNSLIVDECRDARAQSVDEWYWMRRDSQEGNLASVSMLAKTQGRGSNTREYKLQVLERMCLQQTSARAMREEEELPIFCATVISLSKPS